LRGHLSWLDSVELADYKVRILAGKPGTDAVTRVLVESSDGERTWTTVGVHANIVEASWMALCDALVHKSLRMRDANDADTATQVADTATQAADTATQVARGADASASR